VPVELGESRRESLPPTSSWWRARRPWGRTMPQLIEAARRGLRVIKYSELLGASRPPRRTLAVAGTHGKTTSSWMRTTRCAGLCEAAGRGAPRPAR
jgi:hypothetical protein